MFEILSKLGLNGATKKPDLMPVNENTRDVELDKPAPKFDFELIKKTFGEDLYQYSYNLLLFLSQGKEISHGVFFLVDRNKSQKILRIISAYGMGDKKEFDTIEFGEGFPGQVAKDGKLQNICDIPEGYVEIRSGLGKAAPVSLIVFPVKYKENVIAVIELASFHKFTTDDEKYFEDIATSISDQIRKRTIKS